MSTLRILSWNIHANCGIRSDRLGRVIAAITKFGADIVLLQEVSGHGDVPDRLRSQLGLGSWHFTYGVPTNCLPTRRIA